MPHIFEHEYKIGKKGAWLGIWTNLVLFIFKFSAGILGRSQAMIADSFHTVSDALTSVAVLVGFTLAAKPADKHHPFGHGRAESIAAKIVALVLIAVGLLIAYDSARILITGKMREPGVIALVAAIVSIIVKEIMYRRVAFMGEKIHSLSLKADARHHRSDALSSVAALIGIIGARCGQTFMDPLAGIIVAGFIIAMGAEAFHEAYDELMDAAPSEELHDKIEKIVKTVEDVEEVKKIMVRKSGLELFLEITISVNGAKTVAEGHLVTMKIKREILNKLGSVRDTVVHVEPA